MGWEFLKEKACFMAAVLVISLFSVYLINPVSAQEAEPQENLACCERTSSGDPCRYTQKSNCDPAYKVREFQSCEESDICKTGCCVAPDGSCSKQVSKGTCESLEGYTFDPDANCNIPKCSKGCCVLGGESCLYSTEKKCNSVLQQYPELTKDYRPIGSESECTDVCRAADKGCCVRDDGTCKYEARGSCTLPDGTGSAGFYNEVFCANSALEQNCDCTAHANKACVEGSEDVYWFDSCGNQEDVAENCDYGAGDLCSAPDGNSDTAYCKSINCDTESNSKPIQNKNVKTETEIDDYSANDRRNGESWCLYDGKVGPSYDLVGSRHFRSLCLNGEQVVESCKDLREEICWQMDLTNIPPRNANYREAACLENNANGCVAECNTAKDASSENEKELKLKADEQCCNSPDRTCLWQWTDEKQKSGFCLPKVPPGGKFWSESGAQATTTQSSELAQTCSAGKSECNAVWENSADTGFDWECVKNCECYSKQYLEQKSVYCRSLGDCGAYYNYVGEWTYTGLFRTWEGNWKGWDGEPGDSKKVYEDMKNPNDFEGLSFDELSKVEESQPGLYFGSFKFQEIKKRFQEHGIDIDANSILTETALPHAGLLLISALLFSTQRPRQVAATALIGIGITAAVAFVVSAAVLGSFGAAAALVAAVPVAGWIAAAVILAVLVFITLYASNEKRTVTTECLPWQPPLGGDDCEICDADYQKLCSEYRCRSLGANCRFIKENEGTRKGTCYNADPNDVNRPIISRWDEALQVTSKRQDITSQYQINDFSEGGLEGGYEITRILPSFSRITFGIQTNEPAQCKLGEEFKNTYNELTLPFPDTYFSNTHNITIAPLLPNKTYEYYVICRDPSGNPKEDGKTAPFKIKFKTDNGPDLEPPLIIATDIANNGKVRADADSFTLGLFVDEVSQFKCKYSALDKDYNLMEKNTTCAAAPLDSVFKGYAQCAANLTLLGEEPNTYYFRCADEPVDLAGVAQESNINGGSFIFTVTKSKPLQITQASPQGQTIYSREATMQVKTAEGADNGIATCYYDGNGFTGEFFTTNQTSGIHEQKFTGLPKGFYNFGVTCYDYVKNAANDNINFTIDVDLDAPIITGLYTSGSSIILNFNEATTCQYYNSTFVYGQGQIAGTAQQQHTFSGLQKYHIICEDAFNNRMQEAVIVSQQAAKSSEAV